MNPTVAAMWHCRKEKLGSQHRWRRRGKKKIIIKAENTKSEHVSLFIVESFCSRQANSRKLEQKKKQLKKKKVALKPKVEKNGNELN